MQTPLILASFACCVAIGVSSAVVVKNLADVSRNNTAQPKQADIQTSSPVVRDFVAASVQQSEEQPLPSIEFLSPVGPTETVVGKEVFAKEPKAPQKIPSAQPKRKAALDPGVTNIKPGKAAPKLATRPKSPSTPSPKARLGFAPLSKVETRKLRHANQTPDAVILNKKTVRRRGQPEQNRKDVISKLRGATWQTGVYR